MRFRGRRHARRVLRAARHHLRRGRRFHVRRVVNRIGYRL